jgi:hypothetical protein
MTIFQWIALPILFLVLLIEVRDFFRARANRSFRLLRIFIWAGAMLAISIPEFLTWIANALGIGLGVNLLVYVLAFCFLIVTFYFYAKIVRLQREITDLVRALALQNPMHGAGAIPRRNDP